MLTSCENFLKGGEIKAELEEAIEIANSKPILYHIIADKDSGTVSPSQATLKKKESVNLLFTPADGWSFICWEALDRTTGEPVPDAIQFENPQKLETKAKILKPTENLMIHPKCQLVPKVIEITPKFDNSGCDQDRTIEIIFNKSVDPQTFDFAGISITTPEGTELFSTDPAKSFFDTPYFSDENKVLNIPTIKGKFLLLPEGLDKATTPHNSEKATDEITIRIDFTNVKDTVGLSIEQPEPHTYRVNKTVDNVAPVITEMHLFSTSDETDYFKKELTDKPFFKENGTTLNWSSVKTTKDDGTTEFQNGDYSQNHVSQLYITLEGYDSYSGIKEVRIKETYKRDKSGNPVTEKSKTLPYSSNDYAATRQEGENTIYNFAIDYQFNSENTLEDGLFLIQIFVVDEANNESIIKDYWVIKDTYDLLNLTQMVVYFKLPTELATYNNKTKQYETKSPIDRFELNPATYYSLYKSRRLLKLEMYEENSNPQILYDELDIGVTQNQISMVKDKINAFVHNAEKNTFFRITLYQESGIIGEMLITIPKAVQLSKIYSTTYSTTGVLNDGNVSHFDVYYYYTSESQTTPTFITSLRNLPSENTVFTLYPFVKERMNIVVDVYSVPCKGFVYDKNGNSSTSLGANFYFPEISFPDPEDDAEEITYTRNSGTAKFTVEIDDYADGFMSENGYTYNLLFTGGSNFYGYAVQHDEESDLNFVNAEIPNGWKYNVSLNVIDSNGIIRDTSEPQEMDLRKFDNIPPKWSISSFKANNLVDSNKIHITNLPFDQKITNMQSSTYLSNVIYWFVPSSLGSSLDYDYVNTSRFTKGETVITQENKTQSCFDIPFDGLSNGSYILYYLIEDNANPKNSNFGRINYTQNHISNVHPKFTVSGSQITIEAPIYTSEIEPEGDSIDEWGYTFANSERWYVLKTDYLTIEYLDTNNNIWTGSIENRDSIMERHGEITAADTYYSKQFNYVDYENKFVKVQINFSGEPDHRSEFIQVIHMLPLYVYTGYYKSLSDYEAAHPGQTAPAYCTSKTWMPMANGWQIFNDKPCFVHTRYCSKNLTEPGDLSKKAAYEWEARAQETGIVYNDGSTMTFSYTDDNLAGVPSGYYYTTICHFADGTVVMSEVKQK